MKNSSFCVTLELVLFMATLILLGSGTGVPSLRRASPGVMILSKDLHILIDSGPGLLRKMLEVGFTYRDPDLILYTHLHPDHTADLIPFLFACKYGELPREKNLTCIGGPGFKDFFKGLEALYEPWIKPQTYKLFIRELSQEEISFRNLKIVSKSMAHLPGSIGYRIEFENGKSMVISGDTDYCQNIVELAKNADLLVLECSFPDGKKVEGHLTPSWAGRIAKESKCKKLLLTHFYPPCDREDILSQCRKIYNGLLLIGEDLMKIEL